MVPSPSPQTFPALATFTTFTTFAKFAKFAKFATFDCARDYPTLIHRHAPHL